MTETMTMAAYARRHGVSKVTVGKWLKRGALRMAGELVDVAASDQRLAGRPARYRGGAAKDKSRPAAKAAKKPKALVDSLTRKEAANAELAELRLARERGEWISRAEIWEMWSQIMVAVRQMVLALPNKIAFEIPTLTPNDRATIERICRDDLEDASMARGFLTEEHNDGK
jgi:hypothetical protein